MLKKLSRDTQTYPQPPEALFGSTSQLKKVSESAPFRVLSYALFIGVFVVILLTFNDYGLTWDERVQRQYGDYVLRWYSSLFHDHSALHYINLFFYGGFFEIVAQLSTKVSPLGIHETRHLINALFGLLAIVGAYKLGAHLAGSRAGFFSALFLTLTPVFYGHSFNNPKDIPFAALMVFGLYYLIVSYDFLPRLPRHIILKFGIATGLALGVRIGSVLLFGYIALLWASWLVNQYAFGDSDKRENIARLAGAVCRSFFYVALVSWVVMLLCWPWAQISPLLNPLKALRAVSKFQWPGLVFFDGRYYPAADLPRSYLPTWFAISLPEFYFIAGLCGLILIVKYAATFENNAKRWEQISKLGLLLVAAFSPILTAVALDATLYDGLRHFLFVIPPLAILAGIAFTKLLSSNTNPILKMCAITLVFFSMGLTVSDMVQLHPYQSVYFNRVVGGGSKKAAQRFETDYWGSSYKEGAEWVIKNYHSSSKQKIRVANPSDPFLTGYYFSKTAALKRRFATVRPDQSPHLFLTTTRFGNHHTKIRETRHGNELLMTSLHKEKKGLWVPAPGRGAYGRVLHIVQRQGVPLLYVIEVAPPGRNPKK